MLNPHKMYKQDKARQHKSKVTWGPSGKPKSGMSGSTCYEHYNVDWTVHRLTPEILDRAKEGGRVHKKIHKGVNKFASEGTTGHMNKTELANHMRATSPRWGDGHAPGRHMRKVKPRPTSVNVNGKHAAVAVGGVAAVAGGAYYYRHRKNKLERVENPHHKGFHATHLAIAGRRH